MLKEQARESYLDSFSQFWFAAGDSSPTAGIWSTAAGTAARTAAAAAA